jgi:hypothetical protein
MAIWITGDTMVLETGNRVVAAARFGEHAAADGNGAWTVSACPSRLFSRDQAMTVLMVVELPVGRVEPFAYLINGTGPWSMSLVGRVGGERRGGFLAPVMGWRRTGPVVKRTGTQLPALRRPTALAAPGPPDPHDSRSAALLRSRGERAMAVGS